jgi:hypothetical protein
MRKTIAVLIFFVAALLAGYFARSMVPAPSKVSEEPEDGKERFMQKQRGMPLDMQKADGGFVSGYDGVSPILGSEPKPLSEKPYDMANDQELFQFQDNRVSADCCPSPFSSDTGCVCLTDAQLKLFESRGGNKV